MLLPTNTLKAIRQAICPLEEWLPEQAMQAVAAEDNLSETAFFVPEGDGFALRRIYAEQPKWICAVTRLSPQPTSCSKN